MMTTWIALLRAVNVGGTGKLPMADLRQLCTDAGFQDVQTYIQSGNVVLTSPLGADDVRRTIEDALESYTGARVDVMVRGADELVRIVAENPFPQAPGAKVGVALGHEPVPPEFVATIATPGDEEVVAGARELYIHYPDGMGRSKLKIPAALGPVTVRNVNTLTKLVAMAAEG